MPTVHVSQQVYILKYFTFTTIILTLIESDTNVINLLHEELLCMTIKFSIFHRVKFNIIVSSVK